QALLDLAATAAATPRQQVDWRLARVEAMHASDGRGRLALFQEILDEPALRAVPVYGEQQQQASAGALAATKIAELIESQGRQVYAGVEVRAMAAMEQARLAEDPAALLEVTDRFPNARAAAEGIRLAADAFMERGRPLEAAAVYRRLLGAAENANARADLLESAAVAYARAGRDQAALELMRQAASVDAIRPLSGPLLGANSRPLLAGDEAPTRTRAVARLAAQVAEAASAALPKVDLPRIDPETRFENPAPQPLADGVKLARASRILAPLGAGRNDRLVSYSDEGVSVWQAGEQKPLAAGLLPGREFDRLAWTDGGLLLVGRRDAALLDTSSLDVRWSTTFAEPNQAWREDGQDARQFGPSFQPTALAGEVLVSAVAGGVVGIDLSDGSETWRLQEPGTVSRLVADDAYVAAAVNNEAVSDLLILEARTGVVRTRRQFERNDENGGIRNMALSPGGRLVYLLPDSIVALDLALAPAEPAFTVRLPAGERGPAFAQSNGPGQLVVEDGRVLVVSHAQTPERRIRAYNLLDGKPVTFDEGGEPGKPGEAFVINTEAESSEVVRIIPAPGRAYLAGNRSLTAHGFEDAANTWSRWSSANTRSLTLDVIPAQGHLLLLELPDANLARGQTLPRLRLNAFDRSETAKARESGILDYLVDLEDTNGVLAGQWQVTDGGIYLVGGDNLLRYFRSNAP
ncbi:MAG: PQQ-binding-like beta-propeller repeat protein, partial [Phycisphaerae bacterium]